MINFLTALAFVELGLYVRDWLGVTEAILLGAMTTGASVGSGVGTVLAGRLGFERRAGRYLILLTFGQGLAIIALAFSHTIWLSVPLMVLFGIFPGMAATIFLATMQAIVPNRVLGRVLAADEVGSYGLVPLGQYRRRYRHPGVGGPGGLPDRGSRNRGDRRSDGNVLGSPAPRIRPGRFEVFLVGGRSVRHDPHPSGRSGGREQRRGSRPPPSL